MLNLRFLTVLLAGMAFTSPAHAILLSMPVECTIGETCFIQNYVDHQTGEGWRDFRCGHLSYDSHKGTDFRIPSLKEMEAGVKVLAVADGVVENTRDGMDDVSIKLSEPSKIKGRECGNGVMLKHADGWSTQYCHMKKGSISVQKGDEVSAGNVLGEVGLSGNTEFPHLHITLRHNDEIIDPFTGKGMEQVCGQSGFTKWHPSIEETLSYSPPGLIAAGFSDQIPDSQSVMAGDHRMTSLDEDAKAILFWAQVYGPREGDIFTMELLEETTQEMIAENTHVMESNKADYLKYIGKKNPEPGIYIGRLTVTRVMDKGPEAVISYENTIEVK